MVKLVEYSGNVGLERVIIEASEFEEVRLASRASRASRRLIHVGAGLESHRSCGFTKWNRGF